MQRILFTLMATFGLLAPVAVPTLASAAISDQFKKGACLGEDTCDAGTGGNAEDKVTDLIAKAIDIFSLIVGVIAVVMMIIGGIKYITSQGESSNVTAAKNTILYAAIGIIIVVLAQTIVFFVFDQAQNISS